MASKQTKIILIVVGAVVVFGAFLAFMFNLFPSQEPPVEEPTAQIPDETDLSFIEDDEPLAQNQVFDSSNRDEFSALARVPAEDAPPAAAHGEAQARSMAEFFIVRFGTYSSDAGFSYIEDLEGYMTPRMVQWAQQFRGSIDRSGPYYAVTSAIDSVESAQVTPAQATVSLIVLRSETSDDQTEQYRQHVEIRLVQDSGAWKVDGVFWGERL